MRFLIMVGVLLMTECLSAQTILDTLSRPTASAESELLRQANEDANNQANAAAKRASLLSRRANELRSQVDALERKVAALEAEHAALKSTIIEGRDLVLNLFNMLENQELTSVPSQILKIRSFYDTSLHPKLAPKPVEPPASDEGKMPNAASVKTPSGDKDKPATPTALQVETDKR